MNRLFLSQTDSQIISHKVNLIVSQSVSMILIHSVTQSVSDIVRGHLAALLKFLDHPYTGATLLHPILANQETCTYSGAKWDKGEDGNSTLNTYSKTHLSIFSATNGSIGAYIL